MTNKRTEKLLNELGKIELEAGRKRYIALPHLYFLLGLFFGLIFNLASNILHDLLGSMLWYQAGVLVLTLALVVWVSHFINKIYIKPINTLENQNKENYKKLLEELLKK